MVSKQARTLSPSLTQARTSGPSGSRQTAGTWSMGSARGRPISRPRVTERVPLRVSKEISAAGLRNSAGQVVMWWWVWHCD